MSKEDQIEFVEELCDNVKNKILRYIDANKIPENWDGIELRWLIADQYHQVVFRGFEKKNKRKRAKEYENHIMINYL